MLLDLKKEVLAIRISLLQGANFDPVTNKWIPRHKIMDFFRYGATQMAELEKDHQLVISKIGKRKFYHRDSLENLLEKYIINQNSQ